MEEKPRSLAEALGALPDPRRKQRRAHELAPLLLMSVCAMLCGARSLYAIAQWGRERREDDPALMESLGLRPGTSPSVATLHRVFKGLDAKAFERILSEWLSSLGLIGETTEGSTERSSDVLAVDGKSLRGIHGETVPGVHLVAVYSCERQAVLAQVTAGGKGTELTAVKEALSRVALEGRIVTGDALQTQREVCEQVVGQGGITSSA